MRLAVAVALLLCAAGPVRADEPGARCLLRVVHALPQEGGVDEKLAPLKDRLTRAPFREWKTFKLLSTEERDLQPSAAAEYPLPGGQKASLLFAEHATSPEGKHLVRGSFKLEGGKSTSRTMFSLDEGGVLLVAGQKHAGGILIYALSCKTEK
ncbi:MAG: hypothetical protein EXR72_22060 [Myxococcales bacterium]|nr:hypothetical protein [Myxococcales bacterium]